MGEMIDLFTYAGTSGAVQRETSLDREHHERTSGETKKRGERFLALLNNRGAQGLTWKELQAAYSKSYVVELHHGQISGLLTNLHKTGSVFISPTVKRDGCFAYIASRYKELYQDEDRFDSPVQTKSGIRRAALEKMLGQVRELYQGDWHGEEIRTALTLIVDEFDQTVASD